MRIQDKHSGEIKTAIYATTPAGNKRYNVDGKFYSDRAFDKKFKAVDSTQLEWRANTPALLKEMVECGSTNGNVMGAFRTPINIFLGILAEVAQRAIELDDPKLNALMCRLSLYDESDPYSDGYNKQLTELTISNAKKLK